MFKKIPINSVIIALSCIGAGLVILSTWHYSIGLWEDSIGYIATAKNLLLGKGFISYNAQPITLWPPFYPILLYLLSTILGPNLLVIALLLNAVLFGLIIYEFGTLLTKYINSEIAILLGLLYTLFSIPIFSRTLWAGSEIIFIFLYIWHTHFLVSYLEKKSLTSFIMIVILTAFAILTRYIGITLIFTTGIAIIIYNRENIKKNIGIILIYSILSIIPISIWSIRNYMISKSLFGVEGTSEASFPLNIYLTIKNIIAWYVPVFLVNQKIFLFIITLTIIALGVFLLKRIKREDLWLKTEKKIFLIQSSFILIYLFLLILIATFKAIDNINSRLLSPVFIPIIFLLLILIHSLKKNTSFTRHCKLINKVILVFLFLGLIFPVRSTFLTINNFLDKGGGYSGKEWNNAEILNFLKFIPQNSDKKLFIYSNYPHAVYFLANTYAKWSPPKTYYNSNTIYENLSDLEGTWPPRNSVYLVWFRQQGQRDWLYTPKELMTISNMKIIDSVNTGSIYLVSRVKK